MSNDADVRTRTAATPDADYLGASFRSLQLEAMLANLNNRDVLLVLASGGQSPAIRYASLCLPHVSKTQRRIVDMHGHAYLLRTKI